MNSLIYKSVVVIFSILLISLGFTGYKNAENKGYERGKLEVEAKYKDQSEKLTRELSNILYKGFEEQQKLLTQSQEVDHERLKKTLSHYRDLGKCHTSDGISMLNEQIRKRQSNNGSTITP